MAETLEKAVGEANKKQASLSYPPRPKGVPKLEAQRQKWKEQKRVKCCHEKCWYPLNLVMREHQRVKMETETGDPAFEAECVWDRRHKRPDGSAQYITEADQFRSDTGRDPDKESLE